MAISDNKLYKVTIFNADIGDVFIADGITKKSEPTWKKTEWSHEQWNHFFACYLVYKKKQDAGKLHSIIESFGGSETEVKARKSVAFQLLGLKN